MGWLNEIIMFIFKHPIAFFTGIASLITSIWVSYYNNFPKTRMTLDAVLSVFISLAIIAIMLNDSYHLHWLPIVGIVIGFIGPERICNSIIGAWNAKKNDNW
jgi:divalent metal cation (Fe/Co/Zn/Cd) transporter